MVSYGRVLQHVKGSATMGYDQACFNLYKINIAADCNTHTHTREKLIQKNSLLGVKT